MNSSGSISPNSEYLDLHYSRPSQCVIVRFRRWIQPIEYVDEVYYRRSVDPDYSKVRFSDDLVTCSDLVVCSSSPMAFLNLARWNSGHTGSDWDRICALHLPSGRLAPVLDRGNLRVPSGYVGGWIASLIDADATGTILTCRVALALPTGPDSQTIQYMVSEVDLSTGGLNTLVQLSTPFG